MPTHPFMGSQATMVMYILIYLAHNGEKNIIKHIEHINFTKLTLIELYGNKLTSIEGLVRVRMPLLQYLELGTI